jgi:hypothetical protein
MENNITKVDLEETIGFWARNDFAIINSLLVGNINNLWEIAEIAYKDNKDMLKEHEDGVRTLDEKSIESLQSRIIEKLDDETKAKILKTAKNDILNILNAMKPTKNKIMLYRTAWIPKTGNIHHTYQYAYQYDSLRYNVNDILEFKIISSTSITPYREDAGREFYRYEITVPKNGFVLELDQFPSVRNEEGEVLLPPMKCKVKNIRNSDNEKCRGIIELEYIEKLPANIYT